MKYLVIGSCGMAGHIIAAYLSEQRHDVYGVSRRPSPFLPGNFLCDVKKDLPTLDQIILSGNYDYVINCVGILNQFAENNKDDAVFINSYLPHHLAAITKDIHTAIVHLSTDCVFSGEHAPYREDSPYDGRTFYDRSKAMGELCDEKNLTLRGSIVGPDINENGIGLFNWFMKQTAQINGFRYAIWTGQTTLQLAKTIELATSLGLTGLYNTVPSHSICKFDLLQLFNTYMKGSRLPILPQEEFHCDKTLIQSDVDFCKAIPDYETMIAEMAAWIQSHKQYYPHYFKAEV